MADTGVESVDARLARLGDLPTRIHAALEATVEALGLSTEVNLLPADRAIWRLERDPYSGEASLVGEWRDAGGRRGGLLFHSDGSFLVEQDVGLVHPRRPRWFVEAVHAWGRDAEIKAEPRLLPMPE